MINIHQCEPLISGTDIEIYRIAALLNGSMTEQEILLDYPSLNSEKIKEVNNYVREYPFLNNNFPSVTFKKAIKNSNIDQVL